MVDLSADMRWALDPVLFAQEALDFMPDPWQKRVLSWSGKRLALCCSRQSGKSTTTAVLAAHKALYTPGSLTLLVSPSLRQSSELFRKVTEHLDKLEAQPDRSEDNKLSLTLETGSRIVSLPSTGATVRGFSAVDLAILDEDAWVPDTLYAAIRPMLAVSGGQLVLMSTPFGRRGHFWSIFDQGGPEWERITVTAHECPRISPAFLDEERRSLGNLWFRSEYLCEFTDTVNAVFREEDIAAMFSSDRAPLFPVVGANTGAPRDALTSALPPLAIEPAK